jgi:transcriptional regulator with XRE-family HTH domain
MANNLGISKNYVYLIEAGKKTPSGKLLSKLDAMEAELDKGEISVVAEENAAYSHGGLAAFSVDELTQFLALSTKHENWKGVRDIAAELDRRKKTHEKNNAYADAMHDSRNRVAGERSGAA